MPAKNKLMNPRMPRHATCQQMRACVCEYAQGLDRLKLRMFCLFRPSTPALWCLGFITGAGGLPWCLSCICAERVPVAPTLDAVPLCMWLVPRWHRMQCYVCGGLVSN